MPLSNYTLDDQMDNFESGKLMPTAMKAAMPETATRERKFYY